MKNNNWPAEATSRTDTTSVVLDHSISNNAVMPSCHITFHCIYQKLNMRVLLPARCCALRNEKLQTFHQPSHFHSTMHHNVLDHTFDSLELVQISYSSVLHQRLYMG